MRVELLGFEGCPHVEPTARILRRTLERLAPGTPLTHVRVEDEAAARSVGFLGSPSVRIDGVDLEGGCSETGSLSCRVYPGGAGAPPVWLVEAAIVRALRPRGVLFLCVANSARSQMAEGIARSLAPPGVEVWSAGSAPSAVRPEAVRVLAEIGIDLSSHHSKPIADVPADRVDLVVTLCAGEICPAWLGAATRLHWGLPDPAAAAGDEETRLAAFRSVRDELRQRLAALFRGERP